MAKDKDLIWKEYAFPSGAVYRGSFLGTRKEGRGFWRHPEGETYEGGYHDNKQHGWGTYRFGDSGKCYRGQWNQGEMHGKGLYVFSADEMEFYIGTYEHDKKHGKGLYRYQDGRVTLQQWKGGELQNEQEAAPQKQFEKFVEKMSLIAECDSQCRNLLLKDDDPSDEAVEKHFTIRLENKQHTFPSGASYAGDFLSAKKHGKGLWTHPEGDMYDGQFRYNKHSGFGIYKIGKSGKKFIGGWREGKMDGWGVYFFNQEESEYFVGIYKDDQKHGWGVYYFQSGGVKSQNWQKGELKEEKDCDEETHKEIDVVKLAIVKEVAKYTSSSFKPSKAMTEPRKWK